VAERLLAHAHSGATLVTGSGRVVLTPDTSAKEIDPRISLIASSIEYADAPISILEVSGEKPSFNIVYANSAMSSTTQYTQEQLTGKSLAELEAWTPEFLTMVLSFIQRGAIVSYVPLWSETRQAVPVHLSFYPIRGENDQITQYLVIHHF